MAYGEHHLDAYDPEIGRTRTHTADELQKARGRSLVPGYRFYSEEEAEKMQEQKRMQEQTDNQLLEKLVDLGNKFRLTSIVDDDFPAQRDNFDTCLREATEYLMKKRKGESGVV